MRRGGKCSVYAVSRSLLETVQHTWQFAHCQLACALIRSGQGILLPQQEGKSPTISKPELAPHLHHSPFDCALGCRESKLAARKEREAAEALQASVSGRVEDAERRAVAAEDAHAEL